MAHTRQQLLELFSDYAGEDYVQSIAAELGVQRSGGFNIPGKILIILFASRSGSNYLGQLLSATGWFNEIGESFRPSQLKKVRERHGFRDCHEAAQWMIDNRGTPEAFGFKAGMRVLVSAAVLGALPDMLDRAHVVLLRRRDRLAQAVSLVKSRITGRTHSGQPAGRELSDNDYDADAIAFQLNAIKQTEAQFAELAGALGKRAPILYYEDICAEPERHVTDICRSMGLAIPDDYEPNVRVQILRDELSGRWVERFRAEHPEH